MTDTIQDHHPQDLDDRTTSSTSTSGSSPTKSKLPLVLAVGGAAAVLAVAAIAFWPESSSKPAAATAGFASGTSVDVVLTCASPAAPCSGGVTAPDGSQWFWSTTVDQAIPAKWQSHQVTGSLVTQGDWGTVTYTSSGETHHALRRHGHPRALLLRLTPGPASADARPGFG